MLRKLCACLVFLISGNLAWAGIPTEETVVCPIGGEEFTVTGTLSCSTQGRTMSYRQISTCDFVTRLPICPSNGLPVYQEFTDAQVADLTSFMQTPAYETLATLSPWQRAYGVAVHLGQSGTETSFGLLLNALWHDTAAFYDSPVALDQLLHEAEFEFDRTPPQASPFLNAILGYALARAGRSAQADDRLALARQAPGTPEYLQQYIQAVEACQSNMDAPECHPDAPFNP